MTLGIGRSPNIKASAARWRCRCFNGGAENCAQLHQMLGFRIF